MATTINLKTTGQYLATEMMTTHYHNHQPTSMSTSKFTGNALTDSSIPFNYNNNTVPIGIPSPTALFLSQQHSIFVNSTFTISNLTLPTNTTTTTTTSELSTTLNNFRKEINLNADDNEFWNLTWPKAFAVSIFIVLILITIIGNTLVILAVSTTRRLRTVTNCFVMNLAITDWLVGTFVMPPAVVLYILESWRFGWVLCDVWISLDVLLCTASILSLCAISLDRYLAVIQPLTYSKKQRSKRLALFMILIVWIVAFSITCPPFLGWYEQGRRSDAIVDCRYNQNKGYVVFSAMGSFFIPLFVMLYVYLKIGYVLTSRRQRIERAEVSEKLPDHDIDCDNFVSESECATIKNSPTEISCYKGFKPKQGYDSDLSHPGTFYELLEISKSSSTIQCSTITCKFGSSGLRNDCVSNRNSNVPMQSIHFTESRASFSESCLSAANYKLKSSTLTPQQEKCPNHHQQQQQAHQQQNHHHHTNAHQHHHHHHHHQHQHHQHSHNPYRIPMRISTQKRDSKTAKTLTIVMGGFIACWLPFFIYYILIPFLPRPAVSEGLMSFLTWVGWVNCAINPFIYAFYNPDFRTAFWRLTFRKIFKKPSDHLSLFRG